MSRITQTPLDLDKSLRDQINFLRNSVAAYDAGFEGEAKRLAVTTRVLVHDTAVSQSLLGLLSLKNTMTFIATGDVYHEKQNFIIFHGLAMIEIKTGGGSAVGRFRPRCLTPPRPDLVPTWKSFDDWWNQVVVVDLAKQKFTRRNLVLTLANMEGGAHVDPDLNADWAALTRENSMRFFINLSGTNTPVDGIETASCRQIAEELMQSIFKVRPDLAITS